MGVGGEGQRKGYIEWLWEGKEGRRDTLNGCGRGKRREGEMHETGVGGEGGRERCIEWV